MPNRVSRRVMLRRSAAAVAGGAAATVLFNTADAQAAPVSPDPSGAPAEGCGTVVEAGDGSARVALGSRTRTVPVVGFPDGWRLSPGDRVSVGPAPDTAALAAQPLVTRLVGPIERADRSTVMVAGTTVVLDPTTIRGGATARGAGSYEVYFVTNDREPNLRAVVVRPLQ
jgi:hypothetical protein